MWRILQRKGKQYDLDGEYYFIKQLNNMYLIEKEKIIMKDDKKLTRETIKQTVEDFFTEHEEKELTVTVSLDSNNRKTICNFHIDAQERAITEDSTKTELIISNYASPLVSLVPDDVTIRYEEVARCEAAVRTGETKDDILADVLEITFKNGTVMELGFLCI